MPIDTNIDIINVAKVAKYLSAYDEANNTAIKGGTIQGSLSKTLFTTIEDFEWAIANGVTNASIAGTANYLVWLSGSYIVKAKSIINGAFPSVLLGTLPIITLQPVSGNVANTATITLTITATGYAPITYQWQKYVGSVWVNISGATAATFTKTNADLIDIGQYRAVATNQYGSATSNAANITVSTAITAFYYYGSTNPYPALSGGSDVLTYQVSQAIAHNQPITLTLPSAGQSNMYGVVKVPIGELLKTAWYNTPINNGQIPDAIWYDKITIGLYDYYVTRTAYTYVATSPLIFS